MHLRQRALEIASDPLSQHNAVGYRRAARMTTTTTPPPTANEQRQEPSNDSERRRQYCSDSENDVDGDGRCCPQVSAGGAAAPEDAAAHVRGPPGRRASRGSGTAHLSRPSAGQRPTATATAAVADRPDAAGEVSLPTAMHGSGGVRCMSDADYAGTGSPVNETSDDCTQNGNENENAGSGEDDEEASRQVDLSSSSTDSKECRDELAPLLPAPDDRQDNDFGRQRRSTGEAARAGRREDEEKETQDPVSGDDSASRDEYPLGATDSISHQRRRQSSGQVRRAPVEQPVPVGRPEAIGQPKAACPLPSVALVRQQCSGAPLSAGQRCVLVESQVLLSATTTTITATSVRRHYNKGVKRSNESVEREDANDDSSASVNVSPLTSGAFGAPEPCGSTAQQQTPVPAAQNVPTMTGPNMTPSASRADTLGSLSPSAADNHRRPTNCSSPSRHYRRRIQPPEDDTVGDQATMTQSQKVNANSNTDVQQQQADDTGLIVAESFDSNSMDNNNTDNVQQQTLEGRQQQQPMDENIGQPQIDAAYNSNEDLGDEARQGTDTEDTDDQSAGHYPNELDYESVLMKILNEKKLVSSNLCFSFLSPRLVPFLCAALTGIRLRLLRYTYTHAHTGTHPLT